jgi:hypothetical protein
MTTPLDTTKVLPRSLKGRKSRVVETGDYEAGGGPMKPSANVFRQYSTWTIALSVSLLMNLVLVGGPRSTDMLLRDLLMCGLSTASGLAAAALWWILRREGRV